MAKDYLLFPLLSGPSAVRTLAAITANLTRNVWAHVIIWRHPPSGRAGEACDAPAATPVAA